MLKLTKGLHVILLLSLLGASALSAVSAVPAFAASIPSTVNFTTVVSGLTQPVFVTNAGDGSNRLFIVQQTGQIRLFKNGSLLATPFLNISGLVSNFTGTNGEQGLLSLAFDPNYRINGIFYITYTTNNPDPTFIYTTTLARYHVSSGNTDLADTTSGTVLLSIPKKFTNHNGGMLAFGPDGFLYMSMGDGGSGGDPDNNAQNLHTLLGKLIRLDVESTPATGQKYVIPSTNPFFTNSDPTVKKEIWAYGLRNPWRFSFDRTTGDLYIGDVGQNIEEEVDFQPSSSTGGQNYGWRIREGNLCFNPASNCGVPTNYVPPVATYDHGTNDSFGCALTGGYVYRGSRFPSLQGVYFYGDYCSGKFLGLVRNPNNTWTSSLIVSTSYSISSFGQDEQGELYLTDYGAGNVIQISPGLINISGNVGVGGVTLSYTDGTPKTVLSHGDGSYSISVPFGWSGTVAPSLNCYTFTPSSITYSNLVVNQPAQNYSFTTTSGCGSGGGTYDDTDPNWIYSNGWMPYVGPGPVNNTDEHVNIAGGSASFTFSGTGFTYVYLTASSRGNIGVYVDGSLLTTLNALSSALVWQKTYTSPTFAAGTHTVTFMNAGPPSAYIDVDAIMIRAPDVTAPGAISDLAASTGPANGSVSLMWSAPPNDAGNNASGAAASYLVRYSTSAITDTAGWNAATPVTTGLPVPGAPGSAQTMIVPGLTPGSTYFFDVRAQDATPNLAALSNSPSAAANNVPVPGAGTYDDTDPNWVYSSGWMPYVGPGPVNNTDEHVNIAGGSASFTFSGTGFTFVYLTASNRGNITVKLDGSPLTTLNANTSALVWQKTYTSPTFAAGTHTVTFMNAGPPSAYIDVDAIMIRAPDVTAPGAISDLAASTGPANGSVSLTWSAPPNDAGNNASGAATSYLVRYSTSAITDTAGWNAATPVTTGLPVPGAPGSAQTMIVPGLTPGSTYFFDVRAQDATPNLAALSNSPSAAANNVPVPGAGTYDDTDPNWIYSSGWMPYVGPGPVNNTDEHVNIAGGSASFTFSGTGFIFTYMTASNRGNMTVRLDGSLLTTLNANTSALVWQKTYTSPTFAAGTHTVTFMNAGPPSAYIDVDAIMIRAPDVTAPVAIGDLAASTGPANGSVSLTWSAPPNDAGNNASGAAASYLVRYSTSAITDTAGWNAATPVTTGLPVPGAPGSAQTMIVPGLTPGSTYFFDVRAQDATPNLAALSNSPSAAANNVPVPGAGTYDDTDPNWVYSSGWMPYVGPGPVNNTDEHVNIAGGSASFTFSGTGFTFVYLTASNRGNITVKLDGSPLTTLNANTSALVWQKTYTSPTFAAGTHTVTFMNAGPPSAYIDVDAITVQP